MIEVLIKIKNKFFSWKYRYILRPVFFNFDPEWVHNQAVKFGKFAGRYGFTKYLIKLFFSYSNQILEQNILGIDFKNPVGLAAGFDKEGELIDILPAIGFGFAEIGSITGESCSGNPKPRLWRLKKSQGLVVYYGLKNSGAKIISARLRNKQFGIPIGISIAKTNSPNSCETAAGICDYVKAGKLFSDIGDYLAINISCPNAYGGQPFSDAKRLGLLLDEFDKINYLRPIFLKLPPDLKPNEIDEIISVSRRHQVNGFICSNLTKDRSNPKIRSKIKDKIVPDQGGISGRVVEELANELITQVYKKTKGEFVIIGCGGIFSAQDAYKKIRLGASLVQLITGAIYKGPQLIAEINQGLVSLIKRDGFTNISQVVGIDNK